nr:PREDICTED: alpha-mannosidase 2 [Bemisia tabaci]XP_018917577.1 PREDICTED: alpha-mannosidase 2 [Bemisia tabaci]
MKIKARIAVLSMTLIITGCLCYSLIVLYTITDSTLGIKDPLPNAEPVENPDIFIPPRFQSIKPHIVSSDVMEPMKCSFFNETLRHDINMLKMYHEMKFDNTDGGAWKQGWNVLAQPHRWTPENKLKVFVMPHSHNDPGWKMTFEEYFKHHTKNILDNMVVKLKEDPRRKFIWAEISFFSLWWNQISEETKISVQTLLRNRQLEIVTGGWVMNDEANSHYYSTLQQLTHGHQWLHDNLNYTSKTSWQIDPFGHSPTQPFLLKKMFLEGVLIQRTHYIVKKYLAKYKSLEFRWTQAWDNTETTGLLTHMMPFYSYDVPHTCGPDPKVCCQFDFRRLPGLGVYCPWNIQPQAINDNNLAYRSELLLDQYRKKAELYSTRVVLAPLGDDFRYDTSKEWDVQYTNYQKMFDYLNSNPSLNVEIQFGTLLDYFDAIRQEKATSSFPSLSGDFFTYADRDDHYWSGYYTSRPFYKRMERELVTYLRSADMIFTLAWKMFSKSAPEKTDWLLQSGLKMMEQLSQARSSLSLFQHHDGITGTAKDYVVIDYADKMVRAMNMCKNVIQKSAYLLLTNEKVSTDHLLNSETILFNLDDSRKTSSSLSDRFVIYLSRDNNIQRIVLFNTLSRRRKELISLRVSSPVIKIVDSVGTEVNYQINLICRSGILLAQCYEVFFVAEIDALELKTYLVMTAEIQNAKKARLKVYNKNTDIEKVIHFMNLVDEHDTGKEFLIQNDNIAVAFSSDGFLKAITLKNKKITMPIHLNFIKYRARLGQERSGAYLFLPDGEASTVMVHRPVIIVVEGPVLSQVHLYLEQRMVHTIEIYHFLGPDEMFIGIQNIIDLKASNSEYAMLISTNIQNDDTYYTDLNGLQMVKRQRFQKLPLQANYYPMASAAYIEDNRLRLTLLSAQPLGAASLKEGQLEVMQDRRLMQDDNLGLGQGVTDNVPTISLYRLLVEQIDPACHRRPAESHGALSLAAYAALTSLLYPATKLIWNSNSAVAISQQISLADHPFQPDLHIVSLVTIKNDGAPQAGLVMHRTHFDSCVTPTAPLTDGLVNFSHIIPIRDSRAAQETTLDFIHRKKSVSKSEYSSWPVCIMDMVAFLFAT